MDVTVFVSRVVMVLSLLALCSHKETTADSSDYPSYGDSCDEERPCNTSFVCVNGSCTCGDHMITDVIQDLVMCAPPKSETYSVPDIVEVTISPTRTPDKHWVGVTISWLINGTSQLANYTSTIVVEERVSLGSQEFVEIHVGSVRDCEISWYNVSDLLAFWDYRVYVMALTDTVNGSWFGPVYSTTWTNYPGLPHNVRLRQDWRLARQVEITLDCPPQKQRNGTITGFTIRKTLLSPSGQMGDESEYYLVSNPRQTPDCSNLLYNTDDIGEILLEKTYSFSIAAINQDFTGDYTHNVTLYIAPRIPWLSGEGTDYPVILGVDDIVPSGNKLYVTVCSTCLLDASQGTVRAVGLLVCVHGDNYTCATSDGISQSELELDDFFSLPSWSDADRLNYTVEYRTTPDSWLQVIANSTDTFSYTIGSDTKCNNTDVFRYCNGPVPENKEYTLSVIKCNDAGCDVFTSNETFTTVDPIKLLHRMNVIGLAVGISQGCLAIVAAVILSIIMACRQRKAHLNNKSVGSRRSSAHRPSVAKSIGHHSEIEVIDDGADTFSINDIELSDFGSEFGSMMSEMARPGSRRASIATVM